MAPLMRSVSTPRIRRLTWLLVFGMIGLRVATVSTCLAGAWPFGGAVNSDVRRYRQIANSDGTPYRDFKVEQAPVTLAWIEVLGDGSRQGMQARLMWSQFALDLLVAVVVAWGWGRRAGISYLVLGLPFAVYPFLYLRLDLLSVALAIGAIALVHRQRAARGGVLLAVASMAKPWSLVIMPSFVVQKSWRAFIGFTIGLGAGFLAWVVWAGPEGPRQVATYRGARGWQIESSIGVLVDAASSSPARFERGAMRIGEVSTWARLSLITVGVVLVLAIWLLASRIHPVRLHLLEGICPLAAISALLLTSTLLSPQYAAWLLPFAAIAAVTGDRLPAALTGVIAALSVTSIVLFHELAARSSAALAVVIVRNVLLLVLYCVVGRRLWMAARKRGPATP
jgi:hypothetical protein